MIKIDNTLLRAYIRQARAASADDTDECTIATLTEWQTTALSNFNAGITVTSVSFAGQGTSGEVSAPSDQLMRICELAIEQLEGARNRAGRSIRHLGYTST